MLEYQKLNNHFQEFGNNIYTVAILSLIGIFIPPLQLIAFIFMFIAIGKLKKANIELNNLHLKNFRSKFITSILVRIIGTFIWMIIVGLVVAFIFLPNFGNLSGHFSYPHPSFDYPFGMPMWGLITGIIVLLVVELVIILIAGIIEMTAWGELRYFFETNRELFPPWIGSDAIDGAEHLRTASFFYALAFLIVPIIVGMIFQIMGYFKLSKLRDPYIYQSQKQEKREPTIGQNIPPPPSPKKVSNINYCYSCGKELRGKDQNFCSECGAQIKS